MRYFSLILWVCLVCAHSAYAQNFQEKTLETNITGVTVFLQGAQVMRTGKLSIAPGKSRLLIKGLSPHIDGKSVQVKADGAFTLLSVNHRLNYLDKLQKDRKIDSLRTLIEEIDQDVSKEQSRLAVLSEKHSLLNENKSLGGERNGVSVAQLREAVSFYEQQLTSIKSEELKIRLRIKELEERKKRIEQHVADVLVKDDLPTGEVEVRVESDERATGIFTVTYLVSNAGWYPQYDIRVESVDQPLELTYKADVYQNTGVDWKNVKLSFSNGDPNQSGVAPQLRTWHLNFARNTVFNRALYGMASGTVRSVSGRVVAENGEPVPGANVMIKGSTIGTVTDINGNYSLTLPNGDSELLVSFIGYEAQQVPVTSSNIDISLNEDVTQLSEVVVVGYGSERPSNMRIRGTSSLAKEAKPITTTVVENQTTVEFEVDKPYSIKSNGEKLTVNLTSFDIPAVYEYFAVPKLDKDAFLIARLVNWDQYNLLEGEANLYFEDAYVGRSVLDAKALSDTLNISLGRDKNIVIGRKKIDEYSRRRVLGANKLETRGFKILVRNKKSQPVKLTLFDQIPVPVISDISVEPTKLTGGKLEDRTGEVTWELDLNPQDQTELELAYEVKYPRKEKVTLE